MLKRLIVAVMLCALMSATVAAFAQQKTATPAPSTEATAEATPESTEEAPLDISEIPQGRLEDGGFYIGEENAPIIIVEFADWACPHCQTYRAIMDQVIEEYVVTGM